ncbi:hypothetical protein [Vibrio barjaei]|uniref:hypothetical protein n=1 Tax=Vibrio barjaei TaxID=1676683 RepID=UPI00228437B3|nr:hypothetical protein [Vibrio barjaei]MCY9873019.1 hypothetical protein [Vibrio barjaei]
MKIQIAGLILALGLNGSSFADCSSGGELCVKTVYDRELSSRFSRTGAGSALNGALPNSFSLTDKSVTDDFDRQINSLNARIASLESMLGGALDSVTHRLGVLETKQVSGGGNTGSGRMVYLGRTDPKVSGLKVVLADTFLVHWHPDIQTRAENYLTGAACPMKGQHYRSDLVECRSIRGSCTRSYAAHYVCQ